MNVTGINKNNKEWMIAIIITYFLFCYVWQHTLLGLCLWGGCLHLTHH